MMRVRASSIEDITHGEDFEVVQPVNLYRSTFGAHVRIGPFVEIQQDCRIGSWVKIGSHTFIAAGTQIGDRCFIGHGVMFCNDNWPRSTVTGRTLENISVHTRLKGPEDWTCEPPIIEDDVSLGSGCVVCPGVIVGCGSMIGAGSVITRNIPAGMLAVGNPCRVIGAATPRELAHAEVHFLPR